MQATRIAVNIWALGMSRPVALCRLDLGGIIKHLADGGNPVADLPRISAVRCGAACTGFTGVVLSHHSILWNWSALAISVRGIDLTIIIFSISLSRLQEINPASSDSAVL